MGLPKQLKDKPGPSHTPSQATPKTIAEMISRKQEIDIVPMDYEIDDTVWQKSRHLSNFHFYTMSSQDETSSQGETFEDDDSTTSPNPQTRGKEGKRRSAPRISRRLTDEESFEIEKWRMRLMGNSMFSPSYIPQRWERNEMDSIIESLGLKSRDKESQNVMAEFLVRQIPQNIIAQ